MTTMRATMSVGITFGLVNVPAKIYKAADDRQGVKFNQLHKDCGERIREPKSCPKHGAVSIDDVVKGYEVAPDQFVVLSAEEIGDGESSKVLDVSQFVAADSVPFPKETYYIGTDKLGARAYALMLETLRQNQVVGVTRVSMRGRERLATIEPFGSVLALVTHYWPEEARDPAGIVPTAAPASRAEVDMASQLITGMTTEFAPDEWSDGATTRLLSIIEDKIAGRPVVARETPAAPDPTQDLMAALQASLKEQAKPKRGKKAA